MGRKKRRHKGRSARKRIQRIVATSSIQWVRLERKHVKLYRLQKRIAWRKSYHSHENRAFVSLVGVKGKAQVKPGPVVYRLVNPDNDRVISFSTKAVRRDSMRGITAPKATIKIHLVGGIQFATFHGVSKRTMVESFGSNFTMSNIDNRKDDTKGAKVKRPTMVVGVNISKQDVYALSQALTSQVK